MRLLHTCKRETHKAGIYGQKEKGIKIFLELREGEGREEVREVKEVRGVKAITFIGSELMIGDRASARQHRASLLIMNYEFLIMNCLDGVVERDARPPMISKAYGFNFSNFFNFSNSFF